MSLPEVFDQHMRRAIGAHAVWLPGKPMQVGDIMVRRDDAFFKIGHISDFGATLKSAEHADISLDLNSAKVKQRIFQAGVELPDTAGLDLAAQASVKYEFSGKDQFVLKTPTLNGLSIQNMLEISNVLKDKPGWKHNKFYIVEETYGAVDWSFIGTKDSASSFELAGSGSGILSFLSAGFSAGLKSSGNVAVKIMGKGGMIGMNLVRINEDGQMNHG